MTTEAVGIYFDYSKHRITDETIRLLLQLADESGLRARIDAMFRGEKINVTEKRAVLHVALRAPKDQSIFVDGEDVVLRSMQCSTKWPISQLKFAVENGKAILASRSVMSSILALVALI